MLWKLIVDQPFMVNNVQFNVYQMMIVQVHIHVIQSLVKRFVRPVGMAESVQCVINLQHVYHQVRLNNFIVKTNWIFVFNSKGLTCYNEGFCRNNQSTCCCPIGSFVSFFREFFFFYSYILGYTGSQCQYLATCTPGITCLNGGSCNPIYDTTLRTHYFDCNCPLG